jgi:phage baseplate assembly protein W
MADEVYIGFSTIGRDAAPFRMVDIELVKQDLLNALQTIKGERVMRPDYGTIIYDLLMDPFDDETKDSIIEDAINIISQEPRVSIVSVEARELEQVMRLDVILNFIPQNTSEHLIIDYDRKNIDAV